MLDDCFLASNKLFQVKMAKRWPPPAMVEDEIVSLAREYGPDPSNIESEKDKAPPGSQGAVDQSPIILNITTPVASPKDPKEFHPPACQQEPISIPPPLPTHMNEENKFLSVPRPPSNDTQKTSEKLPQRPASASPIDREPVQRRLKGCRVYTDSGLDNPWSHASASHPDKTSTTIENSDSDISSRRHRHRSRSREHRQRSKSRVRPRDRPSEHHHSTDEYSSGRKERRTERYHGHYRSPSPEIARSGTASNRLHRGHSPGHGHLTPPQTPSTAREPSYLSAGEDSYLRRTRDTSQSRPCDRPYSRDSPYASPVEESYKKGLGDKRAEKKKLHLDLRDVRTADNIRLHSPPSVRTPKIIEEDLQQRFEENHKRLPTYRSMYPNRPSPLSSPAISPPQTESRSRDYFEFSPSHTSSPKQRSRPPSIEEGRVKPLTTLLSAAIGGSMSSKAVPSYPRSSPSPLDSPLNSSHSSIPSGQRSRRHSPVRGEPRLGSRNAPTVAKEEIHLPRSSSYVNFPVSQTSSATSFDGQVPLHSLPHYSQPGRPRSEAGSLGEYHPPARASGVVLHQDHPAAGNGSHAPGSLHHAPPAQRAHSYTSLSSVSSSDQSRLRPSQRRSYSTANGAIVMPSSSQHPYPPLQTHHTFPLPGAKITSSPGSTTGSRGQPISLPKCPYVYPVRDISNWYTIRGLPHFLICPACIQLEGGLVLRGCWVPNACRAPVEGAICSLSKPWIRIAIAQSLQTNKVNIPLLDSLNQLPNQTLPCPGKNSDVRKWYHITDPTTKLPMTYSDSCGACVRSAELLFPELRQHKLFERPADKLVQERRCMLNPTSKHFYKIAHELDKLAGYIRKNDLRSKDIVKFGELMKSKSMSRECQKDTMLATPLWHFIPALPEFTICEECFDEVVWPLRDKPVAREVQKTLQPVPVHRPGVLVSGVSCYLYSKRMRQAFQNAVDSNDFTYLKRVAITRFLAEQRLQATHKALMDDLVKGIDRRAEVEKNIAEWRTFE